MSFCQQLLQADALKMLHNHKWSATTCDTEIENLDDAGMMQLACYFGFRLKGYSAIIGHPEQALDRDSFFQGAIDAKINFSDVALPQQPYWAVAINREVLRLHFHLRAFQRLIKIKGGHLLAIGRRLCR